MSPEEAIEQVLREHEAMRDPFRRVQVCICDGWADTDDGDGGLHTHAAHVAEVVVGVLTTNGWALTRIPEPEHRLTAENCLEARGKGYPISSGNVCHVCAAAVSPTQPPSDDLDDLRAIKDAALAADTGDPVVDAYERAAIQYDWETGE